jgi:hypothetical protein
MFIGTAVARHGVSSVNGGRFTPPGAPTVGLYETTNGGLTFKLAFSQPSDPVDPTSPSGNDFFRGGVSKIEFDPTTSGRVYFSMFDYGLYRGTNGTYEQVFTAFDAGDPANSANNRVEFDVTKLSSGKLRIYLADARTGIARLYRVDDAGVPASTLTDGTNNPGWLLLSDPTGASTGGFASYDFCRTQTTSQCSYDMVVASPPGHPDTVWIRPVQVRRVGWSVELARRTAVHRRRRQLHRHELWHGFHRDAPRPARACLCLEQP